jgi:hypothetical protein
LVLKCQEVDVSIFRNKVKKVENFCRKGTKKAVVPREREKSAAKQWV